MKIWAAMFCMALALPTSVLYVFDNPTTTAEAVDHAGPPPPSVRFEIDPSRSKFMVKASRGGVAWFKGHDHHIAVRDFSGQAELTSDVLAFDAPNVDLFYSASLNFTVRAASLEETSDVFTQQQKGIINKELKEIVLETAKYPEITFRSTDVKGELKAGKFEVKIGGDMTLHGVTKHITIPATVSVEGNTLHAVGEFSLDRSDFNVKATSAFHGMVRIKNSLKFTFDIVGRHT
jgi:polyisoprenoid-binding protein YceI